MEFFLHNEEGIQFPPIRPSYQSGERYFNRFCCLIPRDAHSSILGEGGAGTVHLARDETMDRLVALKLLSQELQSDPMARLDVIRETRQAMDLTHPNIVRIHDFHEGREGWGISMQYIKGLDLDKWRIENSSGTSSIIPYPVERIEDWVRQLCDALAYAHDDAMMVHRDIKPRNLMLERRDDGREKLYLTDFGITKKLATHTLMVSKVQPAAKDEKAALGTLPYMSWQQLEDETPTIYDDIYSVGATIYDLITGRPPFFEGSYDQIRHQIENTPPPTMAERLEAFALPNPGIPSVWEEVVRDCLMKDPQDRPTSLREISERLGLSSAAPVIVQSAPAAPVGNPAREAELEETLSTKDGEIANLTRENESLLQKAEVLASEKEQAVKALEAELLQLRESIASGDSASESLKAELAILQATIGQREEETARLQEQIQQVQKTAQLDGDEAMSALRDSIAEKDAEISRLHTEKTEQQQQLEQAVLIGEQESAQVVELSKAIGERENEAAQLREQLAQTQQNAKAEGDEATAALRDSLAQKDAELQKLRSDSGNQQAQLDEALRASESERARAADLEVKLQSTQKEYAGAAKQIEQARSQATAAIAERDGAVAKSKRRVEQTEARLSELKKRQSAPLTPLLVTLLGSLILGVGGGILLGKFMPMAESSEPVAASLDFTPYESQIPASPGEIGTPISAGLFRDYALTTGVSEEDLDKLAPGLSEIEDEAPVAGLTYLMAESFCAWLTVRDPMDAIDEDSRAHYYIPARDELPSSAGQENPEWTSTPYAAAGANDARQIAVADASENDWLVKTWTSTLKNRKPMTFRVILSEGPK